MLERARPDGGFLVHLTYSAAACDAEHRRWKEARGRVFNPAEDANSDIIDGLKAGRHIVVREDVISIQLPGDQPPRPRVAPRPISAHPRPLRSPGQYKLAPRPAKRPD